MGQKQSVEHIDIVEKCVKQPNLRFHEEIRLVNGHQRNVVSWLPMRDNEVKAVIFISHGLAEHSLAYYLLAAKFVAKGYAVYAMDHCSHGKSEGRRGVIPDYRILYSDYIEFFNGIRCSDKYKYLPAFLFCHSMGTLVAMTSMAGLKNVSAVCFSAPALFSGPDASSPFGIRCLYPLTQTSCIGCLVSTMAVVDPAGPAAPIFPKGITSDDAVLDEMSKDPRRNKSIVTNKTGYELLKLIRLAREDIPRMVVPFLCIHGDADQLTLKKGSEFIFKNAGTHITDRRIHIFPNLRHECINEKAPHGDEVMEFIVKYFEEQYQSYLTQAQQQQAHLHRDNSTASAVQVRVEEAANLGTTREDANESDKLLH